MSSENEPTASASEIREEEASSATYVPVRATTDVPFGRGSICVENRDIDGWYRKSGISKAYKTDYAANNAMDAIVSAMGVAKGDVCDSGMGSRRLGTWISLDLAKKMLETAGMDAHAIHIAFCPPGVAPRPIGGQPTLDGEHGKMLNAARVLRPVVPGHTVAVEFVSALDGMVIRANGRFVDATLLMKSSNKEFGDFWDNAGNKAFFDALVEKRQVAWTSLIVLDGSTSTSNRTPGIPQVFKKSRIQDGGSSDGPSEMDNGSAPFHWDIQAGGGVWVDYALGVKMATWANKRFEVEVCDLVTRYMRGQLSSDEIDATRTLLTRFAEPVDGTSADGADQTASSAASSSMRVALSARERGIAWSVDSIPGDHVAQIAPEDTVMVFGHPYLRVTTPMRDAFIPPSFGHRQLFYIIFRGLSVRTGMPLWELGCTNDMDRRLPEHARAPFPTARIAILMATTACASRTLPRSLYSLTC